VIFEVRAEEPSAKYLGVVDTAISSISASSITLQNWFQGYANYHRARIATDLEFAERFLTREKQGLDCGAAPFIFTTAFIELGYQIDALDKEPSRFRDTIGRLKLKVMKADIEIEPWPIETGTYDFIIFNEIFEHTANLLVAFSELNRVLKNDGLVLLSTPNGMSAENLVKLFTTGTLGPSIFLEQRKRATLGHMGHIREYTPLEVTDFCSRMGFVTEYQIHRGIYVRKQLPAKIQRVFPTLSPSVTYILRKEKNITHEMIYGSAPKSR
jgi:SAM-dependent methyltransferase